MPGKDEPSPQGVISKEGSVVLTPDPTYLTRHYVDATTKTVEEKIVTRLDAMDKATQLMHEDFVRVPTQLTETINCLREVLETRMAKIEEVTNEKLKSIDVQFKARKETVVEQNELNAKAILKSEVQTTDAINKLQALFQTSIDNINVQITDVKSRLDRGEGRTKGLGDGWGYIVGAVGALSAVVALIAKL